MSYQEIELDKVEDNPYQTRTEYDEEALAGIMSTANDNLGIRYAPIVRPHPEKKGYYQIASGHGRILALKALGRSKATVRIEALTDRQMKTEILIENVNRANLNEEERFQALEAIRLDPDTEDQHLRDVLKNKTNGWIAELSRRTGINTTTLRDIYDVKEMRDHLVNVDTKISKDAPIGVIQATRGLDTEDREKLIVKADEKGWSQPVVRKVRQSLQVVDPKVKRVILEDKESLTPRIIEEISELKDPEEQTRVLQQIKRQRLDEGMALRRIRQVKEQEPLDTTIIRNEYNQVMEDFRKTTQKIKSWGVNQYMIVGEVGWSEATQYFDDIEKHMKWLKMKRFSTS